MKTNNTNSKKGEKPLNKKGVFPLEILNEEIIEVDVQDSLNFPSETQTISVYKEIEKDDFALTVSGNIDCLNGVIQERELDVKVFLLDEQVFLSDQEKKEIVDNLIIETI